MVAMSLVKGHCNLWVSMLVLFAAFAGGCARRLDLSTDELKLIEGKDPELVKLRVYPKRKLIALYREAEDKRTYDVEGGGINKGGVTVRGAIRPYKQILGRKVGGKIIARTELNGMPKFWVAFDNECADTACAFGFVLTELGRWQLHSVPDREKYQPAENYRRNTFKRNRLKVTKQKSLAEANEVYAIIRRGGKRVLTIDLQFVKDDWRPTRTKRDRLRGAD